MQSSFDQELFLTLVAKSLSGNAESAELRELEIMLQQFPEAQAEFEKLEATWNLVGAGFETEKQESEPFNEHLAWQKVSKQLNKPNPEKRNAKTRQLYFTWLSVAASVLVLLSVSYWVMWSQNNACTTVSGQAISQIEYYDGSTISLSSEAELAYSLDSSSDIRQFDQAKGAAYYVVAKNPQKPFVVSSKLAEITVLGTQFLVNIHDDSLELSVEEGRVQLKPTFAEDAIIVSAGEKWVVNRSGTSKSRTFSPNALAWANKQLRFSNTPLEQVVKDIEELYKVEIELDSKLKTCKLSGSFRKKSLDEVLDAIAETLDLEITKTENTYKITGKGC